ncbi:sialate O-acetylesterase [Chitinophaga sp. 22321]|uniref:Sialate O-acetylesterase n=1 Tax=Chitinophaga hostae TaxID=2831022 RepID=A0ABS5J6Z3_9BACT|nr:sialate O-acetylesterase [Chitinophaga hostae]MBS0030994.1 sialate O-acetylesterase [Chitinophaga hostae]
MGVRKRFTLSCTAVVGICISILLLTAVPAAANIRLPAIIGSNMVLQQQHRVKLWGWADPLEKVVVTTSWDRQSYPVTATGNARWEVSIQTPAAGGPYSITFAGKNKITLTNIMLGEVWICGGQSNMEMCGQWGLADIKAALPTAANNDIRFFHIPKTTATCPQDDVKASWTTCDSSTLNTFSAVAYFFGKKLQAKLHVAIGLVAASWGGTSAEVWTPDSIIQKDTILKTAAAAIAPSGMCPHTPGIAWNAMLAPITNYAAAGAIWYQGENNTSTAGTYARLFTKMIDAWRCAWQDTLPFYFVQIAPFNYREKNVGALLREAQWQSSRHLRTGMVVIMDLVNNVYDVHPANKHDVGARLADRALGDTYHIPGAPYENPSYQSAVVRQHKMLLSFDHAATGLTIQGKTIRELFIAGSDQVFYPAECSIKNNTLLVWSSEVKTPVAVRYAFSNTAIGNLFSNNGLPVGPFRTDGWPVATK